MRAERDFDAAFRLIDQSLSLPPDETCHQVSVEHRGFMLRGTHWSPLWRVEVLRIGASCAEAEVQGQTRCWITKEAAFTQARRIVEGLIRAG